MDFGKVDAKELGKVDFSLAKDPPRNKTIVGSAKGKATKVYVGCAKWGRPDWIGKIYPKGTKAKDFLEHYAHQFQTIELNATFYNIYPEANTKNWSEKTG